MMVALAQVVGRGQKDREACTAVDVQARGDVERLAPMERRRPCDASQGNLSIASTAVPCAPSKTVRTLHAALHADLVVRRTHAGSPSEANSLHAILLSALPRWIGPPH
jgi:hypothetical protein